MSHSSLENDDFKLDFTVSRSAFKNAEDDSEDDAENDAEDADDDDDDDADVFKEEDRVVPIPEEDTIIRRTLHEMLVNTNKPISKKGYPRISTTFLSLPLTPTLISSFSYNIDREN